VPLLPGYRWHWIAQLWRRRPIGELLNATTTRGSMALLMRQARGDRSAMPGEFVEMTWRHWDAGTQAATLALYRHADPDRLAVAGRQLGRIECPALVVWADRDAYLPLRFGEAYAEALPGAELEVAHDAGHWPWIDDPPLIERILRFLG
jgi:pimeloyl-ACP methyl ester carboxylesterase